MSKFLEVSPATLAAEQLGEACSQASAGPVKPR